MNEIRQAYEDYAIRRHRNVSRRGGFYVDIHAELDFKIWMAAYEAGEIAMKEKAAKEIGTSWAIETGGWLDSPKAVMAAIRALPLSGAEEAKK